ncbi:MBL fold metallo-hydrolase [Thermohalobacter berrensis]|uniref:MBL fold metallo-hydrolase n=1 Tax=Thermohalobacter berrensis TaxID=99594 RepID=A0A419T4I9_9FIRM|nr:MBL fold metallo-hydrolase [Thermohalobacter berrensis]RKD32457.1 MBL fold metallo-hydrolase [Thermohalobacter berrensis]
MDDNLLQKITEKPMVTQEVTHDILLLQFPFVNAFLVGDPSAENGEWALVGAGMAHTAKDILQAVENRFGKGSQPTSIILTHGHFDHVGSIAELVSQWTSPIYAHELEIPYLTGQQDYPPADPSVDEGLIAKISPTFPNKSIDLGGRIHPLPNDGSVPGMPGWRWIHTPGHTPGHISLFKDSDRILISGDAITTVEQESAESVLTQEKELNGPPAYFTTDWQAAKTSVETIKDLNPSLVISSHGLPMQGEELRNQLENLVNNFDQIAIPKQGRFINK